MKTVLVAGATGTLGPEVVRSLNEQGYRVRVLTRLARRADRLPVRPDEVIVGDALQPQTLRDAVRGVDALVSCVGAPVSFSLADRRGYLDVDIRANGHLIDAARHAGVRRFVYVAVHTQAGYADTAYIRAHEAVIDLLQRSGLGFGVVRPTGIFPIFVPLLAMARLGLMSIPGDGRARTNPVHPTDVAAACVEALGAASGTARSVGGPDVLSRDELALMACEVVGRRARVVHVPKRMLTSVATVLAPVHPRLSQFVDFAAHVFTSECVAPSVGRLRLRDYLVEVVRNSNGRSSR